MSNLLDLVARVDAMDAEVARMRIVQTETVRRLNVAVEALCRYADDGNWGEHGSEGRHCVFFPPGNDRADGWLVARNALEDIGTSIGNGSTEQQGSE